MTPTVQLLASSSSFLRESLSLLPSGALFALNRKLTHHFGNRQFLLLLGTLRATGWFFFGWGRLLPASRRLAEVGPGPGAEPLAPGAAARGAFGGHLPPGPGARFAARCWASGRILVGAPNFWLWWSTPSVVQWPPFSVFFLGGGNGRPQNWFPAFFKGH